MKRRRSLRPLLRGWRSLSPAHTGLKEIDEESHSQGIVVGRGRIHGAPARGRKVARMADITLEAVNPSVNASGLTRSGRHGVDVSSILRLSGRGGERNVAPWVNRAMIEQKPPGEELTINKYTGEETPPGPRKQEAREGAASMYEEEGGRKKERTRGGVGTELQKAGLAVWFGGFGGRKGRCRA